MIILPCTTVQGIFNPGCTIISIDKDITWEYYVCMRYEWNEEKNKELRLKRGFNFDDILPILEKGEILEVTKHRNSKKYPKQYVLFIMLHGYVCEVPFIYEDSNTLFLKTIYKSRKPNRRFKQ